MRELPYDRLAAVEYARKWAFGRNPAYYNFDGLGGDCTNFASQCIYAGSGVMNFTPTVGWYYIDLNRRSPSWTGVQFLCDFLLSNGGMGPKARLCRREELAPGDIVQIRRGDLFVHSLVVTIAEGGKVYIASHTYDSLDNDLDNYVCDEFRYLHIEFVRK